MSERLKYSKNGVYRCGNFAQNLAQNTFPTVQLGTIEGINGWFITLKVEVVDNRTLAYPLINCHNKPQLNAQFFFNLLGKDGKSFGSAGINAPLFETYVVRGPKMNTLAILNEKNGCLENGTLSFEYGIHISGILGDDRIWKFNLNDKPFIPQHTLKINFMDPKNRRLRILYCHKQLLHSPLSQSQVPKFITRRAQKWLFEDCLQIAHGVRIQIDDDVLSIALLAHNNTLRNVVQYVDQQLVAFYWCPNITELKQSNVLLVKNCIEFGLRHFLARLVDPYEGLKDLKDLIQKLNIDKMSGEAMKKFTAKLFKLGT